MRVVFIEDVSDIAETGEIKEVADGYARNFLIPKKLAILADVQAANIVEARLKKKAHLQAQIEMEMTELARQLEGQQIALKARTGKEDRLYGSVTNADIAEELYRSTGLAVDKRKIELDEPIREIGSYAITIRLTKDIIPGIKLTVTEEAKKGEDKEKRESKKKKVSKPKAEKIGAAAEVVEKTIFPVPEGSGEKKESKEKKKSKTKREKVEVEIRDGEAITVERLEEKEETG
ncbi:MAG: 50S ribosomal protein L9 [Dehalococcoidales bacterium]|jgi:large subunit ribosomal protein L9|nr:50S ribosomal protein L9 [Dehalococcoidales bacterium]MDP7415383.1 50S ribosomal protein L9 [Dehalococcoidales bacterium]